MCFTLSGCDPKAPPLDHIPLSLENYSEYLDIFITPNYLDDGLFKSFSPLVEISTKYSSDDIVSSSSVTIKFFAEYSKGKKQSIVEDTVIVTSFDYSGGSASGFLTEWNTYDVENFYYEITEVSGTIARWHD